MPALMPVCMNCAVYSWQQVKEPSPVGPFYSKELSSEPLQKCSKCKMAFYCDKDCQKEHWVKVHKDRCKYARGEKVQKAGVHRHEASVCKACSESGELGEKILSKDDPHWGCHMQNDDEKFWDNPILTFRGTDGVLYDGPLAVELGELTGNFTSRLEHVVCVLQKILYKMELVSHTICKMERFKELCHGMFCLRHDLLMMSVNIPPGNLVYHSHSVHLMNSGTKKDILSIIRALGKNHVDNTKDTYRLWDTFILIFDYFLDVQKDSMKDFENIGKKVKDNKEVKLLVAQVDPSSKVQEKWDQVVTSLSNGLAPYNTFLEIVLGNLQQKCSSCKQSIKIESTFGNHPSGSFKERKPVAMMGNIMTGHIMKHHCGKEKCRKNVAMKHVKDQVALMSYVLKEVKDHKGDRCDWCKTMKKSVHRCSRCLTKVYCSQECLNMDWYKVHKEICKEDSNIRKKKLGSKFKVLKESELPETITLTNGEVMVKRTDKKDMVCPMAPCPHQQEDQVGFCKHQLMLYMPWGSPGQPDFKKMTGSELVRFYNKKKKDIEISRQQHEMNTPRRFIHVDKNGKSFVYNY